MTLPPAEKLKLIEELWIDLSKEPADIPIPNWHLKELERRHQSHLKNPDEVIGWEVVLAEATGI